jgi:hypothetical protein
MVSDAGAGTIWGVAAGPLAVHDPEPPPLGAAAAAVAADATSATPAAAAAKTRRDELGWNNDMVASFRSAAHARACTTRGAPPPTHMV